MSHSDPLRSALLADVWLERALLPDQWMCPFCLMEREMGVCAVCDMASLVNLLLVGQDLGMKAEEVCGYDDPEA